MTEISLIQLSLTFLNVCLNCQLFPSNSLQALPVHLFKTGIDHVSTSYTCMIDPWDVNTSYTCMIDPWEFERCLDISVWNRWTDKV